MKGLSSMVFLVLTLMTLMLLAGDYFIKYATISNRPILMCIIAAVLWVATVPGWYYVTNGHKIVITGALFAILSVLGTTCIGVCFFNEKLSTMEILGLMFSGASIFLLVKKL